MHNPHVSKSVVSPTLGIVVPCFNEHEILSHTQKELVHFLRDSIKEGLISPQSFIGFVDDGSRDTTWSLIEQFQKEESSIRAIKLGRNYGHQRALLAGLKTFNQYADVLVSIDADLQDDVRAIVSMVNKYTEGNDIVYGVREKRDSDTWFKKNSALAFYTFMRMLGVDIVYNHADFRLTSKRVIQELDLYTEENIFLRGIFPSLGFKSSTVYYTRLSRTAGQSKYPLRKMLSFAWDGITSFSVQPLRIVTIMGFLIFAVSIILSVYVVLSRYFLQVVHGWASIVLPIYFLGGIQLLAIGIIGEYLGKIYKEVKRRPRYFIEKEI